MSDHLAANTDLFTKNQNYVAENRNSVHTITIWMIFMFVIFLVLGIVAIVLYTLRNKTAEEKRKDFIAQTEVDDADEALYEGRWTEQN